MEYINMNRDDICKMSDKKLEIHGMCTGHNTPNQRPYAYSRALVVLQSQPPPPRGILCKIWRRWQPYINRSWPSCIGGPPPH